MELYVIRHGQTVWNACGKLQGNIDIELNEKGIEAARKFGESVKDVFFDKIYSSPLKRAFHTAELIRGERNIEIVTDNRLKEISFGVAEGALYTDWFNDTSEYRYFFTAPEKYNPPEKGESFQSVIERTRDFLKSVIEPQKDCERIMIVAHGALNKGLMCTLEGNRLENYWGKGLQNNCEADIFTFDGHAWKRM